MARIKAFIKKNWLFLILFILLLSAGAYFIWQQTRRPIDAWALLPEKPVLVIETQDFWNAYLRLSQAPLWKSLSETPEFYNINAQIDFLKTDIAQEKTWQAFFRNRKCLASMHLTGKENFDFLYFVPLESEEDLALYKQINEYLEKRTEYKILKRTYRGLLINEIRHEANEEKFVFIRYQNYWIASRTPLLIEDVARKIQEKETAMPFAHAQEIDQLRAVSFKNNQDWVFYVNYAAFADFVGATAQEQLRAYLKPLGYFAEGTFLSADTKSAYPLWEGLSFTAKKDSSAFLNVFDAQEAKNISIESYLPQQAAFTLLFSFENSKQFRQAFTAYWQREQGNFKETQKTFEKDYQVSLEDLYESFTGEVALCLLESEQNNSADKLLIWKTKSTTLSQNFLDKVASQTIQGKKQYTEKYDNYLIKQISLENFPEIFLGGLGQDFQTTYYLSIGECMVMSNRLQALKKWINAHQYKRTWSTSAAHRSLLQENYQYANLSVIIDLAQVWNILYQNANASWKRVMDNFEIDIKQIDFLSVQFKYKNGQFDTRLALNGGTKTPEQGMEIEGYQVIMNHKFPREVYTSPFLVKNHDTGATEILVQDFTNNLFLLNQEGKVLWQKSAGAPLRSEPLQIDIYQNGKLQYLYLTADRISLVDRLGRDVAKYPFYAPDTLQLNTLVYLDFEDKKHYYLASNVRGALYMYDGERNRIAGWRPKQLSNRLGTAVQHIRVEQEDYLVACSENGTIHCFGREGQSRAGFPLNIQGGISNPLHIQVGTDPQNTQLTALTDEGKILRFNLVGEVLQEIQLIRPSQRSTFVSAIAPNSQEWLIGVFDEGLVRVYNPNAQVLLEQNFDSRGAKWEMQYFSFDNNLKIIALTDKIGSKTYLFDIRGKALGKPFPSNKKIQIDYNRSERTLFIYRTYGREVGKLALKLG